MSAVPAPNCSARVATAIWISCLATVFTTPDTIIRELLQALKEELDRSGPAMLQSHVPELAGELAQRLCKLAGGNLKKVFFASSGSEGVEAAIKFSRAATKRNALLYCEGAFHGLTCGALSLMDNCVLA